MKLKCCPGGLRPWLAALWLLFFSGLAIGQQGIGKVEFVQGMATAQKSGMPARFLSTGDSVQEGEVLTTTEKGYAVIVLRDGTKLTLRPGTSFTVEKFAHGGGEETAIMRLIKGGFRSITGLVGKRNPDGVRVSTSVATIGIRGTSFDTRLCGEDCRKEERENKPPEQTTPVPPADTVVARVVQITGEATARQPDKAARRLREGSPLYVGDELRTEARSSAVIGFRDHTKVSLEAQTIFKVENFSYGNRQAENMAVRLVKGGLRFFTGLIGKKDPSAVGVSTVVATIGIRGTGMDISCGGPCDADAPEGLGRDAKSTNPAKQKGAHQAPMRATDGMFVHTWNGRIAMLNQHLSQDVGLGQTGFVGRERIPRLASALPDFLKNFASPRPDQVDVDWDALFGTEVSSGADGQYTLVRDGHVFLTGNGGQLDLGPGEAGFVGEDGKPRRLDPVPRFLAEDPFPAPEVFNINHPFVFQLFGVTLGDPGQEICEVR